MKPTLQIQTIVSLPFEENTYIVWRSDQRESLVIDPGLDPDAILTYLDEHSLTVAAILNTHGHADHIAGNETMKQRYPQAPLIIGVSDAALLLDANLNLSAKYGLPHHQSARGSHHRRRRCPRLRRHSSRSVRHPGPFAGPRRLRGARRAAHRLRRRRPLSRQHRPHRFPRRQLRTARGRYNAKNCIPCRTIASSIRGTDR